MARVCEAGCTESLWGKVSGHSSAKRHRLDCEQKTGGRCEAGGTVSCWLNVPGLFRRRAQAILIIVLVHEGETHAAHRRHLNRGRVRLFILLVVLPLPSGRSA